MANFKIQSKLMMAFGAIIMLVGLFAIFSIFQLSRMNNTSTLLSSTRMPQLVTVNNIDTATSDFETYQRDEILDLDPQRISVDRNARLDRLNFINQKATALEAALKEPESLGLMRQFQATWHQYVEASERIAALADVNKNVEALALLRQSEPIRKKADEDLARLVKLQEDSARSAAQASSAAFSTARWLSLLAVGFVGAVMVGVLIMLVRTVARPLTRMTAVMGELASGNMNVDVPVEPRTDEVGDLAKAMASFRDQLGAAERAKAEQTEVIVSSIGKGLEQLAEGDLTAEVEANLTGPFAALKQNFNNALSALRGAMDQVARATGGIHTGAGEIRTASDDLSQRTEQQAASLEETAAAMDEITTTVRKTAQDARRANEVVNEARQEVQNSGGVVNQAVEAMGGIERASSEISEIISVIDGIAFQTNLLALNAGVEAARAGDAGKGFAVVASEVRALAQRAADSAMDVKSRVLASSEQVNAGVALVSQTGTALERIISRFAEISELVSNIAASAEQQAAGLQQVNTAVGEMDSVTQQNAAMVEQATAAARSLATEADELARQVARFKTGAAPGRNASSPARALQERAAEAAHPMPRATRRAASGRGGAVAVDNGWSEF